MIGVSVSDILKLLDQIPIWKTVAALPRRLQDIEARVAALEAKGALAPPKRSAPAALVCPRCGETMSVTAETDDEAMGELGVKQHAVRCACGFAAQRKFSPGKGYL